MKTMLAFALLLLFALPNRAQEANIDVNTGDGNFLLGSCQLAAQFMDSPSTTLSVSDSWRAGYCVGVVGGVSDEWPQHCTPEGVTTARVCWFSLKWRSDVLR